MSSTYAKYSCCADNSIPTEIEKNIHERLQVTSERKKQRKEDHTCVVTTTNRKNKELSWITLYTGETGTYLCSYCWFSKLNVTTLIGVFSTKKPSKSQWVRSHTKPMLSQETQSCGSRISRKFKTFRCGLSRILFKSAIWSAVWIIALKYIYIEFPAN